VIRAEVDTVGELLYLTPRKDGDPGFPNASEAQASRGNIQRLLENLEEPLCKAVAQAASLAAKVEKLKQYLQSFDHLAGSPVDPSLQAMIRREAWSSREALSNASSELTRFGNALVLKKALLDRNLLKFKASKESSRGIAK
jgi:hypothetical protein